MDNKRTLEKIPNISHIKTNPFGQNISGKQVFKRTERILYVIYIMTNNVPEQEPVRSRVRDKGHELLSGMLSLRLGLRAAGDERIDAINACARELISLVWTLHIGGYISRHNTDIIAQAIDDLGQFLMSARSSTLSEHLTLSKQDMTPSSEHAVVRRGVDKQTKKKTSTAQGESIPVDYKGQNVFNNNENRQNTILDILYKGGEIGIKDISSQIVGCSEKTVQRDLADLVNKGLIRKKGKRRWSTYIISSQ